MAEGAGALVLEATSPGCGARAELVVGWPDAGDSPEFLPSHPPRAPTAKPIIGWLRKTLADAGLEPGQIELYQCARQPATPNTRQDGISRSTRVRRACQKISGVSNNLWSEHTISFLTSGRVRGHRLASDSGQHQRIPPADHQLRIPDPAIPFDVSRTGRATGARVTLRDVELVGFGGQNAFAGPDPRAD